MYWYLVQTKPRQEGVALENLQRQGYECYLPVLPCERLRQGRLQVNDAPLFPRYLFARPGSEGAAQNWAPIRSTKGVSRLVSFGVEPAKVPADIVEALRSREAAGQAAPVRMFQPGERVLLTEAPFEGIEAIYAMADGESRVMVLIDILSRQVRARVSAGGLRKVG